MIKKIKSLSELPEWFELKKYQEIGTLTSLEWHHELSWRFKIIQRLAHRNSIYEPSVRSRSLDFFRANPIKTMKEIDGALYFSHNLKARLTNVPHHEPGVRLTTVLQHYETELNLKTDKRAFARTFFAEMYGKGEEGLQKFLKYRHEDFDWLNAPIDDYASTSHDSHVTVNMVFPDEFLIEQFKKLLATIRHSSSRDGMMARAKTKPDFVAWIKFGLLPYLDLYIWQKETGIKIPNRVMADAIFLPGEGGEEVVRKTTSKIAREVMSDQYLRGMLGSISATRFLEQDSSKTFPERNE